MGKKLYCGNLSYSTTSSDLEQLFAEFGTVQSAEVIMDRDTGHPRGFGFVAMPNTHEAKAAISGLSDTTIAGRTLRINEAKPRQPREYAR